MNTNDIDFRLEKLIKFTYEYCETNKLKRVHQ